MSLGNRQEHFCLDIGVGQSRLEVADPTHLLATLSRRGIDVKVADYGASPVQTRGLRARLLPQQEKDGSPGLALRPRRQQAKVAHRVLVVIRDMLAEERDELRR